MLLEWDNQSVLQNSLQQDSSFQGLALKDLLLANCTNHPLSLLTITWCMLARIIVIVCLYLIQKELFFIVLVKEEVEKKSFIDHLVLQQIQRVTCMLVTPITIG